MYCFFLSSLEEENTLVLRVEGNGKAHFLTLMLRQLEQRLLFVFLVQSQWINLTTFEPSWLFATSCGLEKLAMVSQKMQGCTCYWFLKLKTKCFIRALCYHC